MPSVNVCCPLAGEESESSGFTSSPSLTFRAHCTNQLHCLSSNANLWDVARSVKYQLKQSMAPGNFFEKISQNQQWMTANPEPDSALQAFKDQLNYDIAISNLARSFDRATVWRART